MDIKLRFWKNENRDKPTQPHLKNGKPLEFTCSECGHVDQKWGSVWINAEQESTKDAVVRMVDKLAVENGQHAVLTLGLMDVTQQQPAKPVKAPYSPPEGDDPF